MASKKKCTRCGEPVADSRYPRPVSFSKTKATQTQTDESKTASAKTVGKNSEHNCDCQQEQ